MSFENKQECMRVCYQYWDGNDKENMNTEQLSIITYAAFLEIISKEKDNDSSYYIDKATEIFQNGMNNGCMRTH